MNERHFRRQHYYAIAKEIREQVPGYEARNSNSVWIRYKVRIKEDTLIDLALSLCSRFEEDNPLFDPVEFLNKCSPDEDTMPWGELWKEEQDD
jgi:hypothetical protein